MKYFVIQITTGTEELYKKLYTQEHPNPEQRLIIPRRKLSIRKLGKTREKEVPVFPGYIFFEAEEFTDTVKTALKYTKNFIRFLPETANPKPLQGDDLEVLKNLLNSGEIINKSLVKFDENNKITVLSGPLKGLEGKIVKVNKRKGRARVMLSLYENKFAIDFGFDDIARIKNN